MSEERDAASAAIRAARPPFEDIVTAHGPTVLRVCRAVVGLIDADDAWSETFIAALRAYPDLPPDTNFEAWLVTVAHRKSIDLLRAAQRRPIPRESPLETSPGTTHHGEDAPWQIDLYAALRQLPDKQRRAVAYHHLGGLPHRDVAALLGGTEAAARRASADGVRALRAAYRGELGLDGRRDA